jgi:hypothetical protein
LGYIIVRNYCNFYDIIGPPPYLVIIIIIIIVIVIIIIIIIIIVNLLFDNYEYKELEK